MVRRRGLADIFTCCVVGLSGFAGALEAIYPKYRVQRCIVHQLRNSRKCVNWKDRRAIAADLKTIYTANAIESLNSSFRKKIIRDRNNQNILALANLL